MKGRDNRNFWDGEKNNGRLTIDDGLKLTLRAQLA